MIVLKSVGNPIRRCSSSRHASLITVTLDATSKRALAGKSAGTASSPAAARATEPVTRPNLAGVGCCSRSGKATGASSVRSRRCVSCAFGNGARVKMDEQAGGQRPDVPVTHAMGTRQLGLHSVRQLRIERAACESKANSPRKIADDLPAGSLRTIGLSSFCAAILRDF